MAASIEGGGEEGRLKEDPHVAALVPDPSAGPPDTTVLHGYVGKSTRPNWWRLYLDATLASYVEVSEDDILHHRQLADGILQGCPAVLAVFSQGLAVPASSRTGVARIRSHCRFSPIPHRLIMPQTGACRELAEVLPTVMDARTRGGRH